MENEVIIEEKNENKTQNIINRKPMLSYAIIGFIVSLAVIIVAILYLVKVMPRSIAIHIMYPGIVINLLLNGFSMLKYGNKKIAKLDFIFSAVIFVVYVIMFILSLVG